MEVVLENHQKLDETYKCKKENDNELGENYGSMELTRELKNPEVHHELKKLRQLEFLRKVSFNSNDTAELYFRPRNSDTGSCCSSNTDDSFTLNVVDRFEMRRSNKSLSKFRKRILKSHTKSPSIEGTPIPRSSTTDNVSSDSNSPNKSKKFRRVRSLLTPLDHTAVSSDSTIRKKMTIDNEDTLDTSVRYIENFVDECAEEDDDDVEPANERRILPYQKFDTYNSQQSDSVPLASLHQRPINLLAVNPPKKRKSRWYSCLFWCCMRQKPSSPTAQPFSQYIADNIGIEGLDPALVKKLQSLQHREIYPSDYDTLLQLYEATVKAKCCDDDFIQHIPVVQLDESDIEKNPTCAICLYDLTSEDFCKRLLCSHIFHSKCIDECLRTRTTCPISNCELMYKDE